MAKDTDGGDLAEVEPEEFARFKELTGKLVSVPKAKIDAERTNGKRGSR